MPKMQIRFYLGTPIYMKTNQGKHPIMLDGILGLIWMQEHGYTKTPTEINQENLVVPELPIKKRGNCYLASGMFLPKHTYSRADAITKRGDTTTKIGKTLPEFLPSGTCMSPGLIRYTALATPYVDFYADVTDPDEFIRLLRKVDSIGPKSSIGYGRVVDKECCVIEGYELEYRTEEGLPTRPLPVELFKGEISSDAPIGYSTYYAPYWFTKNKAKCYLPTPNQYSPLPTMDETTFDDIRMEALAFYTKKEEAPA